MVRIIRVAVTALAACWVVLALGVGQSTWASTLCVAGYCSDNSGSSSIGEPNGLIVEPVIPHDLPDSPNNITPGNPSTPSPPVDWPIPLEDIMDYTPFYMLSNDGRGVAVWGERVVFENGTGSNHPLHFLLYDDQNELALEFSLPRDYFTQFASPELRIFAKEELVIFDIFEFPFDGGSLSLSGSNIKLNSTASPAVSPAIMLLLH